MDQQARAAFIQAQVACMLAELAAMQAANQVRISNNEQPRFLFNDFMILQEKYLVGHNAVLTYFAD